jgi:hypothetical protein
MHESVWDASVSAGFKLRLPCPILLQNPLNFGNDFWMGQPVDDRPGYFSFKEAGTIG